MEQIRGLGTDIPTILGPTYAAYGSLLREPTRKAAILNTKKHEFSYGPHERQKLDLYTPSEQAPQRATANKSRPVLVYVYGGGFISGDKVLSTLPDNVAYTNIGYFFAEKLGFNTVVMDYRLVSHGAKYPDGGEDFGLVMKWINERYGPQTDVFVLANSAGGVHFMTWLFGPQFIESRQKAVEGVNGAKLQAVTLLGAPYRLDPEGAMKPMLAQYFGTPEKTREVEPTALMEKALLHSSAQEVANWPRLLVVTSEFDPEGHILAPAREFAALWSEKGGRGDSLVLKGHNHLSPPLALGTGVATEENWGFEVAKWFLA